MITAQAICHDLVSIHAPAGGATSEPVVPTPKSSSFNSRARRGRDMQSFGDDLNNVGFNSRARRGRDIRI